ncbi:hypothetical protein [Telluria beijingensis]|uniref:hypothetical protein n=1 Tax=Telluria beijingensis TaxID=3068633 RepID=UPI002795CC7F|nr:hypothetical protein [Massilia sp. REN29]
MRGERSWRRGDRARADRQLAQAAALAPGWDRVWRRIARLRLGMGEPDAARAAFATFAALNPAWAAIEHADPYYRPLSDTALQCSSTP